jgi:hypothetical protein
LRHLALVHVSTQDLLQPLDLFGMVAGQIAPLGRIVRSEEQIRVVSKGPGFRDAPNGHVQIRYESASF